jgi:branched-chain amino acid transport system substrate-binding protein
MLSLMLLSAAACGGTPAPTGPAKPAASGASSAAKKPLVIGWTGGLTGFLAEFAIDAKDGTAMAVKEVNAHGGVLGRQVKVIYEDTGTDPQKARQAVEQLALSDHVAGIVGDYFSPNTIASLPLVDKYKVPMISYDSTADVITHSGHKYIFRVVGSSLATSKAIAAYAMDTLHEKSFVMIGGTDAYSQANMADFRKVVTAAGGSILGTEQYDPSTTKDFSPYFLKYKSQSFGAFFLGGSPAQNALIIKQARGDGLKQRFISTTGIDRAIIWQGAGKAAVGATMAIDTPEMAVDGGKYASPQAKAFEAAWLKAGHKRLSTYDAGHAYDATMVLLKAIEKAGTTSGPKVRQAIFAVGKDYPGAAATFTIEPNGGAQMPEYIMSWEKDGNLHVLQQVPTSKLYGRG